MCRCAAAGRACEPGCGAAASGVVVLRRDALTAEAFSSHGSSMPLPPAAALCAARWLLDAGRSSRDTVLISAAGEDGASTEVLTVDSRAFALNLGAVRILEKTAAPRDSGPGKNPALALFRINAGGKELTLRLFDGSLAPGTRRACPRSEVLAACVSRDRVRVYRGACDALLAAVASCAAAADLGLAEAECAADLRDGIVLVQKPDDGSLVVLAEPEYCFSGEIWIQEGS